MSSGGLWSALAAGFSEFATVVSSDAQHVLATVGTYAASDPLASFAADEEAAASSASGAANGSAGGGRSLATTRTRRLSSSEFAAALPRGVDEAAVLRLQTDAGTYATALSEEEASRFTPAWLRGGSGSGGSDSRLLDVGQQLLRNSDAVLREFSAFFPEAAAQQHSLQSLQAAFEADPAIGTGDSELRRLPPSSFFLHYFVRLNRLAREGATAAAGSAGAADSSSSLSAARVVSPAQVGGGGREDDSDDDGSGGADTRRELAELREMFADLSGENRRLRGELVDARATIGDLRAQLMAAAAVANTTVPGSVAGGQSPAGRVGNGSCSDSAGRAGSVAASPSRSGDLLRSVDDLVAGARGGAAAMATRVAATDGDEEWTDIS